MRAVRIRTDEGAFCAVLGEPGRLYTPYVLIDIPVKKRRMANGDVKLFTSPLMKGKNPYPLKRAANHMLRIGRATGITKGARQLLKAAKAA